MKTLHLSIIVIAGMMVLSLSLVLPAFAEQPLLDYYNNSELVLVGKVISLSQVSSTIPSSEPNQTRYDIQVEQYYKNPQTAKLIIVYGSAKGIYYSSDPTYDVGDRVFLYIDKENGYYQIQPHSLRLHNNCDARPLIPMPSLPFEPPIISMPAYGRLFTFSDSSGNEKTTFAVGEDVNIKFDAENYFPVVNHATVELSVMTENNTKLAFTDKKENITIPACNGNVPVSWSFRPETPGQYSVVVNVTGGLDFDRTEVFYSEPSIGNSFDVQQNTSSVVVEKGPYVSPLKQFKSGIVTNDIKCEQSFQLVIKAEDNSPACVKLDTAYMLIKRGWAASESAYPEGDAQFALKTNSTIIPGHLPRHSGVRIPYQESSRTMNYTGFDGVYNVTLMFRGTPQDYVIKPGSDGTITFEIETNASELPGQDYPIPLPKSLNLTNYAVFYHEVTSIRELAKYPGVIIGDYEFKTCFTRPGSGGTCIGGEFGVNTPPEAYVVDHPGVNVLFEPPYEVLPLGTNTTSQIVTMMISTDSDAPQGTYLVEIPNLGEFLLTVGSQPYHE